ncbi:MAG TPA: hypothetical protein VLF17_05455 [Candidatus Nitrosotenuis sp.]|nr:hypothetical protein [Candidatus Nitrosotenuis sp.]
MATVLGLLEEKGKTKDWLLEQLKRQKIKLAVSPTENSFEILRTCPTKTINHIQSLLRDDYFGIEEVNTRTKTMHWFFTDIVGSSNPKLSTKAQIRKIHLLYSQIKNTNVFKNIDRSSTVMVPTGDGIAIGFSDSPETPLRLAIQLHDLLNKYNKARSQNDKVYIRIGIDTGPVYFIKDLNGNDTVWGPGIIMSRRMMDLCGPNQIFASGRIGNDISKLSSEYAAIMHPIGDYMIKHGERLLVYNLYGKNFGNKNATKKGKTIEKSTPEDFSNTRFEFHSVELRLDITDPKTMMAHHTWIWEVKNLTKEPLSQVYYDIGGDVSKDFSELNVSIKDENNNKLEIISLDVNKGHEKKFNVKIKNPIKRKQSGRLLVFEYDWEEPDRTFEYVFSARCKKFRYVFTAPKQLVVKNRILEVVKDLGVKKRAEPPPTISYSKDKTIIKWESMDKRIINRHDTFEFQW